MRAIKDGIELVICIRGRFFMVGLFPFSWTLWEYKRFSVPTEGYSIQIGPIAFVVMGWFELDVK
jgi:hypothetical protein